MKKHIVITAFFIIGLFITNVDHTYADHNPFGWVPYSQEKENLENEIDLIDLRWRFPEYLFTETPHALVVTVKSSGAHVFTENTPYRAWRVQSTRDYFVGRLALPILPDKLKGTLDFSMLSIGFTILNPSNGLIEERWDGTRWVPSTQRSNRNFEDGYPRHPGSSF